MRFVWRVGSLTPKGNFGLLDTPPHNSIRTSKMMQAALKLKLSRRRKTKEMSAFGQDPQFAAAQQDVCNGGQTGRCAGEVRTAALWTLLRPPIPQADSPLTRQSRHSESIRPMSPGSFSARAETVRTAAMLYADARPHMIAGRVQPLMPRNYKPQTQT
jgi:hypothetical protein